MPFLRYNSPTGLKQTNAVRKKPRGDPCDLFRRETMSEQQREVIQTPKPRSHWGVIAAVVIAAFLIGFVPMWLTARNNAADRDAALTRLRRSEISTLISSAVVDARRGEYETARQEISTFFTRIT